MMSLQGLVLDPRIKDQHHRRSLLLIMLGNRRDQGLGLGPDLGHDPGPMVLLGDLDQIHALEFLDPSPLNDHHEVGLELDPDQLIAMIDQQKHISETKGVQEQNPQISIWMNGGPNMLIIQ